MNLEVTMTSFNTVWDHLCLSDDEVAVLEASMAFERSCGYIVSYIAQGRGGGLS